MAAEGFPVAHTDEYAKPCEPAIHVLRSVAATQAFQNGCFVNRVYRVVLKKKKKKKTF